MFLPCLAPCKVDTLSVPQSPWMFLDRWNGRLQPTKDTIWTSRPPTTQVLTSRVGWRWLICTSLFVKVNTTSSQKYPHIGCMWLSRVMFGDCTSSGAWYSWSMILEKLIWMFRLYWQPSLDVCRLPYHLNWGPVWARRLGAHKETYRPWNLSGATFALPFFDFYQPKYTQMHSDPKDVMRSAHQIINIQSGCTCFGSATITIQLHVIVSCVR